MRRSLVAFTMDRLVVALLFTGIALVACLVPAHNDTWWHLRAGLDTVRTGEPQMVDRLTHTIAGRHYPNYEWLTQLVFYGLWRAGGMPLLTAACALSIWLAHVLLWPLLRGPLVLRAGLLAAVVSGSTLVWAVRPQAFTILLLVVALRLVHAGRWAWLPPLFVLWANLHGAVALGMVVLGGAVVAAAWKDRDRLKPALVTSALCAAAPVLTPLGWRYWWEIDESVARSRANRIEEWRPPALPPEHLAFWTMAIALIVFVVRHRHRLDTPGVRATGAGALLALPLALRAMRNTSPFLTIAAPAMSALLAPWFGRSRPEHPDLTRGVVHAGILGAAVLAAVLVVATAWATPWPRLGWQPISPAAAAAIQSCEGRLYNRYVDGGPIAWFAPSTPVFLDSRQDPYPVEFVQAATRVEATGNYRALFASYGVRCAALPPASTIADALRTDGWLVVFEDRQWIVLEAR